MRLLKSAALGAALLCVAPLGANATVVRVAAGTVIDGATLLNYFTTNDCTGAGGFSACYASQNGVNVTGASPSSSIFKDDYASGVFTGTVSTHYPTVTGSEFAVSYLNNVLSWTYTPGVGDPAIHYFLVSQASQFALFYSASAITSWSDNILTDLGDRGLSHVTWFNGALTGSSSGPGGQEVPEPAALGLLGAGLLGLGLMRRRQNRA